MEKVPQIVSERLKAAAPPVEHPDAELLTAFSERSLPPAERNTVLEHLACCGDCREIVALALPASEPDQQIAHPAHEHGGWLTWPVLRWGLIAAGLLAITSFGVMQYQRRSSMTAFNARRPEAASKITNAPPILPPSSQAAEDQAKLQAPAPIEQRNLLSSNAGSAPTAEAAAPVPAQRKARQADAPRMGGTRAQSQQNAAQSDARADNIATPVLESQRIDPQPIQGGHADSKIERVKPAGTSMMSALQITPPDSPFPTPQAGALVDRNSQYAGSSGVSTRWTISSAGKLQRSLDQGSTWQQVDVNNSSPAAASLANGSLSQDKQSLAKKDGISLIFRAVASNGPDVWAGASGGLLYHSSDAGAHWTRVVPFAPGVSLTGDIVSLEFLDPQHGRVVTSTPEVWTTSDAGQSWQKQ